MKEARQWVVATGHPGVSAAAAEALAAGGNAFDAAVAAGFAGAVAEPALTSLGGGGFLLARTGEGEEVLFDFFVDTPGLGLAAGGLKPHFFPVTVHFPGSDQEFNVGLGSVAVPGNLKGFLHVHRRLGRLPLAEVLAPAVRLARDGVAVNAAQGYFLRLLQPIMTSTPPAGLLFSVQGRYPREGDVLRNPELADFLEELPADQGRDFYEGGLALRMERDMRQSQGLLTCADLRAYRVVERRPLTARYQGHLFLTNPPPSFGGSLIAMALSVLGPQAVGRFSFGSVGHMTALAGVMAGVEELRARGCSGPDSLPPAALAAASARIRSWTRGTTHVSIADREGNVASMTTSNGEGSGYLVPGTGIMLNNMMGEDDLHPEGFHAVPPGRRVASMMSPSLVVDEEGRVRLVIGSGGSKRIRTALLQVISHVLDFGLPVRAAVEAPRIHWDGTVMQVEPGFAPETLTGLRERWPLNVWPQRDMYFGGVHAVAPGREGAGDPRRGGAALGL